MSSDETILAEIKAMISSNPVKSFETKNRVSPYYSNKKTKPKKKMQKEFNSSRLKSKTNVDELFDYVVEKTNRKENRPLTPEAIQLKSKTLPYAASLPRIAAGIDVQAKYDELTRKKRNTILKSLSYSNLTMDSTEILSSKKAYTAAKLRLKYSRLCDGMKFSDADIAEIVNPTDKSYANKFPRSEVWTMKFFEICYDEAFDHTSLPMISDRWRYRNGLDLGSLDAFPFIVKRYLTKKYSVLEVRIKVFLQMLITLESIAELELDAKSVTSDINTINLDDGVTSRGMRATLFTKFLTEELDIDSLALFLYQRNILQSQFLRLKLKDLIATKVWLEVDDDVHDGEQVVATKKRPRSILNVDMLSDDEDDQDIQRSRSKSATGFRGLKAEFNLNDSFQSIPNRSLHISHVLGSSHLKKLGPRKKVVPIKLPHHWQYVEDYSVGEVPLVAMSIKLLPVLTMILLPQTHLFIRNYLMDRIVSHTVANIIRRGPQPLSNEISFKRTYTSSVSNAPQSQKELFIPIDAILLIACEEWKKVPMETRTSFLFVSDSATNMRELNEIYDKDCEKMRRVDEAIRDGEAQLALVVSKCLTLDKRIRRLKRKWEQQLTTTEEDVLLIKYTNDLNSEALKRTNLESGQAQRLGMKKELQVKIEELWNRFVNNPRKDEMKSEESMNIRLSKSADIPSHSLIEAQAHHIDQSEKEIINRNQSLSWSMTSNRIKMSSKVDTKQQRTTRSPRQTATNKNSKLNSSSSSDLTRTLRYHVTLSDWRKDVQSIFVKVLKMNASETKDLMETQSKPFISTVSSFDFIASIPHIPSLVRRDPMELQTTTVEQMRLIHQVISKLLAYNAIKEGFRRASLHVRWLHRKKDLFRQYGGIHYDQAELDRNREERLEMDRKARALSVIRWSKINSILLINELVPVAAHNAFNALYDPWAMLDWPLHRWLPDVIVQKVTKMRQKVVKRVENHLIRTTFTFWSFNMFANRMIQKRNRRLVLIAWQNMKDNADFERKLRMKSTILTKAFRSYVYRLRFKEHMAWIDKTNLYGDEAFHERLRRKAKASLIYWQKWSNLSKKFALCRFNLKDRRFIITFYTWLDQFKKHKTLRLMNDIRMVNSCLVVQRSIRKLLARRKVRKLRAQRLIQSIGRAFIARKSFHNRLSHDRKLGDYSMRVSKQANLFNLKCYLQIWKGYHVINIGCNHLHIGFNQTNMRTRFKKWKLMTEKEFKKRTRAAIKIQSRFRLHWVKAYVLDFYRFRKGLIKLQNAGRRQHCMRRFVIQMFLYRKVKKIQKMIRGRIVRNHLSEKRVMDIHYASSTNNYERLKFYVDRYPELLTIPDWMGNSALHLAAKSAAKRTLKLLLKTKKFDPNSVNSEGLSPLHLIIASTAIMRDEVCLYMLDRGFDEDQLAPGGKSCLHIACEYGRTIIAQQLIENGLDCTAIDENGYTCLQYACAQGNYTICYDLIEHGADVNLPGYAGTLPLHDCVTGANVEVANLLFGHGAFVNVYEPYYYQTPLMWACQAGHGSFVKLFVLQGADVNAKDYKGLTAAHYGVYSNSVELYDALRDVDADFDAVDNEGNSPLHFAAEFGSTEYGKNMLHGMANPSIQNSVGDQPAHVAARYNNVDLMKFICQYDEHIGRVNHLHQTPLGVARFHNSQDVVIFLETHYRHIHVTDGRNAVGDIWWDKPIDTVAVDWELVITERGHRYYVNTITGETSWYPPSVPVEEVAIAAQSAELKLARNVVKMTENNTLTTHAYRLEYEQNKIEVAEMSKNWFAAITINKYVRRKLAYMAFRNEIIQRKVQRTLNHFMGIYHPKFVAWRNQFRSKQVMRIQAVWKGYQLRKRFYQKGGTFEQMKDFEIRKKIRIHLWYLWTRCLQKRQHFLAQLIKNPPLTLGDWQPILDHARQPLRIIGLYEEYKYPYARGIYFYRHVSTSECTFIKPSKIVLHDRQLQNTAKQRKLYGATLEELKLIVKLQALWRGYQIRSYTRYVEKALDISTAVEEKYLTNPLLDLNLFNYALHCHVVLQDLDRARRTYLESLNRMHQRGPDIAFVLYSYCVFCFVSHDLDYYPDIVILLDRARQAEAMKAVHGRNKLSAKTKKRQQSTTSTSANPGKDMVSNQFLKVSDGFPVNEGGNQTGFVYGKCYELASAGFYRHTAVKLDNCLAWENLAACRFLVFNDFNGSFDAYLEAFRCCPDQPGLKDNFDIMMMHFHGKDPDHLNEVTRLRMQYFAAMDAEKEEFRRQLRENAKKRSDSARSIQKWYQRRKGQRIFNEFMASMRMIILQRKALKSSENTTIGSPSSNNWSKPNTPGSRLSTADKLRSITSTARSGISR